MIKWGICHKISATMVDLGTCPEDKIISIDRSLVILHNFLQFTYLRQEYNLSLTINSVIKVETRVREGLYENVTF